MSLTAREHAQVQAATRRLRNAAARARRRAPVTFVRVRRRDGSIVLAATSQRAPGAAYEVVEVSPGQWVCSCTGYQYRGRCSHLEAVEPSDREAVSPE